MVRLSSWRCDEHVDEFKINFGGRIVFSGEAVAVAGGGVRRLQWWPGVVRVLSSRVLCVCVLCVAKNTKP